MRWTCLLLLVGVARAEVPPTVRPGDLPEIVPRAEPRRFDRSPFQPLVFRIALDLCIEAPTSPGAQQGPRQLDAARGSFVERVCAESVSSWGARGRRTDAGACARAASNIDEALARRDARGYVAARRAFDGCLVGDDARWRSAATEACRADDAVSLLTAIRHLSATAQAIGAPAGCEGFVVSKDGLERAATRQIALACAHADPGATTHARGMAAALDGDGQRLTRAVCDAAERGALSRDLLPLDTPLPSACDAAEREVDDAVTHYAAARFVAAVAIVLRCEAQRDAIWRNLLVGSCRRRQAEDAASDWEHLTPIARARRPPPECSGMALPASDGTEWGTSRAR